MPGKMINKQQKYDKSKGQSLVEMALLMPILLVLIISALEFGRLFYTKIVITNAAREGAYYLSLNPDDFDNTRITAQAEAENSGIPDISVSSTTKNLGEYSSVVVTVETKVQNLLILGLLENTFSITATNYGEFPLSSSVEMMVQ